MNISEIIIIFTINFLFLCTNTVLIVYMYNIICTTGALSTHYPIGVLNSNKQNYYTQGVISDIILCVVHPATDIGAEPPPRVQNMFVRRVFITIFYVHRRDVFAN